MTEHPHAQVRSAQQLIEAALCNVEFDFNDAWGDHVLPPQALAAIIIQTLPCADNGMTVADKAYWLEVGEELGPHWVEQFRTAANFMRVAGSFR